MIGRVDEGVIMSSDLERENSFDAKVEPAPMLPEVREIENEKGFRVEFGAEDMFKNIH